MTPLPVHHKKRLHAFFSGRVQGVGFRFTAEHLSKDCHVTGFVRNLRDGRVEIVAEGAKDALNIFLNAILKSHLEHHIQEHQVSWKEATGEFENFEVRF